MRTSDFQNDTYFSFLYTKSNFEMQKQHRVKCLVTHDWRKLVTRQESGHMTQVDPNAMDGDKLTGESKDAGKE